MPFGNTRPVSPGETLTYLSIRASYREEKKIGDLSGEVYSENKADFRFKISIRTTNRQKKGKSE